MFLFKKIVGPFFMPLSICFVLLLFGLTLLWATKKKRAGRFWISLGFLLLAFCSYHGVPNLLLRPLEYRYPPLFDPRSVPPVKWIVVLGGGHRTDPKLPVTSQLSDASLVRLVEGLRLLHSLPESKLILSGGTLFDPLTEAQSMEAVALAIGVDRQRLLLEEEARDTEDQSRLIHKTIGPDPFLLVTSASHMPRSMALFRKQGMNPIPAPAGHLIKERQRGEISPGSFFPGTGELEKTETAVYEYLGLAWGKIRGKI